MNDIKYRKIKIPPERKLLINGKAAIFSLYKTKQEYLPLYPTGWGWKGVLLICCFLDSLFPVRLLSSKVDQLKFTWCLEEFGNVSAILLFGSLYISQIIDSDPPVSNVMQVSLLYALPIAFGCSLFKEVSMLMAAWPIFTGSRPMGGITQEDLKSSQ